MTDLFVGILDKVNKHIKTMISVIYFFLFEEFSVIYL